MGCGTSKIKPERSDSQVTIEAQQRTMAAYRRQRIARDMEQIASMRAEVEVEKALMLKRSSVDDRRPSYVMRVLEDLAEVEEGQEEVDDLYNDPITLNGTYCTDKTVEQNRNAALHTSYVAQQHSVTTGKESEDDSNVTAHAQDEEKPVELEQNKNEDNVALQTSVTQQHCITFNEVKDDSNPVTHAQNDEKPVEQEQNRNEDNIALHTSVTQCNGLFTIEESTDESNLDTLTTQDVEKNLEEQKPNVISDLPINQRETDEGFVNENQKGEPMFDDTVYAQENPEKMDHNLTNHDREEWRETSLAESNVGSAEDAKQKDDEDNKNDLHEEYADQLGNSKNNLVLNNECD